MPQKSLLFLIAVFLCGLFFITGCATMRYPRNYKVEGKVTREFKELDDEKALKLVVLIYNVKHEQWETGIARSIALREYISLLEKRKSSYLKKSGIFKVKYDKVNLKAWKDVDLAKLYESIMPRAEEYYIDTGPELSDMQNTERIVYLTALSAIDTEMRRRNNTNNAVSIGGQILLGAITAALSML